MHIALKHQAQACASLGSAMYDQLFTSLAENYANKGPTWEILHDASEQPVHDATALRLAGTIHRLVLSGAVPALAQHYPSMGGFPTDSFVQDFIKACVDHPREVARGLTEQVQTNEVGRSVVMLSLANWLPTIGVNDFDYLEIGASAGLNMSFDSYTANIESGVLGAQHSAVHFPTSWFHTPPRKSPHSAQVLNRRGTDAFPIDLSEPQQRTRLLSFVWPDQPERFSRIKNAIDIAISNNFVVDSMSADKWIGQQLPKTFTHPIVVFHSIVWQYLHADVRKRFIESLSAAGRNATQHAPLVWARMEPAGKVADLQVDIWNGTSHEPQHHVLAHVGFHGQNLQWL